MNWITNYVRPKINSMLGRPDRDVPENLWIKCPETGEMVFHRDLEENKWVIPASGYHMKMPAKATLGADGKTLVVTLPKALPRGSYKLSYHVVSTDTHRVEGNYTFKIN